MSRLAIFIVQIAWMVVLGALACAFFIDRTLIPLADSLGSVPDIRRRLAAANPAAYEPDPASTLNKLGVLYGNTQRLTEAESQFTEAKALHGKCAASNPSVRSGLHCTLRNLQGMYAATRAQESARPWSANLPPWLSHDLLPAKERT